MRRMSPPSASSLKVACSCVMGSSLSHQIMRWSCGGMSVVACDSSAVICHLVGFFVLSER